MGSQEGLNYEEGGDHEAESSAASGSGASSQMFVPFQNFAETGDMLSTYISSVAQFMGTQDVGSSTSNELSLALSEALAAAVNTSETQGNLSSSISNESIGATNSDGGANNFRNLSLALNEAIATVGNVTGVSNDVPNNADVPFESSFDEAMTSSDAAMRNSATSSRSSQSPEISNASGEQGPPAAPESRSSQAFQPPEFESSVSVTSADPDSVPQDVVDTSAVTYDLSNHARGSQETF